MVLCQNKVILISRDMNVIFILKVHLMSVIMAVHIVHLHFFQNEETTILQTETFVFYLPSKS